MTRNDADEQSAQYELRQRPRDAFAEALAAALDHGAAVSLVDAIRQVSDDEWTAYRAVNPNDPTDEKS